MSSFRVPTRLFRVPRHPHGHIFGARFTLPFKERMMSFRIQARMVRVEVGAANNPEHWANDLAGTSRLAIACRLKAMADGVRIDEAWYLDNDDYSTLWKLTLGQGNPALGLRQLPVARELQDYTIRAFYKVEHVAKAARGDKEDFDKYRVVMGA